MLGDALLFPKARNGWLKTVGIGGVLLITSIFIIPYLVLSGYLVRVIRSGARDRSQPPVFEEWRDLFIDGWILCGIQIIYGIVGFGIPAVVVFVSSDLLQAVQSPDPIASLSTDAMIVLVFAYLFAFFASYVTFVALARFAHEHRFEAAFEMRTVFRTAFTSEFFVAYVLSLSVGLILGAISALFSLLVVGLFLFFYTFVVAYYLIGRGYRKANKHQEHTDTSLV
jgi:hypothetical protein